MACVKVLRIRGASANDVYVVGTRNSFSVILHYDGTAWGVVKTQIPKALFGLWDRSGASGRGWMCIPQETDLSDTFADDSACVEGFRI